MWLSRGPDWHFESDMKEEDLQKDMAKNETKSRPLSLRRARACSEKQRVASRPKKEEAAGLQSVAEYDTTPALGEKHNGGGAAAGHGQERGEERATLAFPCMGMLRKSPESPADRRRRRRGGDLAFSFYLGR